MGTNWCFLNTISSAESLAVMISFGARTEPYGQSRANPLLKRISLTGVSSLSVACGGEVSPSPSIIVSGWTKALPLTRTPRLYNCEPVVPSISSCLRRWCSMPGV